MSTFETILNAPPDDVVDLFYSAQVKMVETTADDAANKLHLHTGQLLCALGFNPKVRDMMDLVFTLGYDTIEKFLKERNTTFVSDIYQQLSLKQVFSIYDTFLSDKNTSEKLAIKLLIKRTQFLEQKIENTVRPSLIENYRQEMATLYRHCNIPDEFVELRLENTESGYRALIDEVGLIVNANLISATELFIRNSVLPEEKRRLIKKGLISNELIQKRLHFKEISDQEREILHHYLSYESN